MFGTHIISALNLDSLPQEKQKQLMEKMTDVAEGRILLRVVESLDDTKKQELNTILDQEDQDALQAFFEANVPDILTIIDEETKKLQAELLEKVGNA